MSNFIAGLVGAGSVALYHDYRSGTYVDLSGNGNDGSPGAGSTWQERGLKMVAASAVTVADAASLQLTAGSIVICSPFITVSADQRFVYKRDAGGTNYDFFHDSAGNLSFYDGTNTRTLSLAIGGYQTLGVNFSNGDTPEGFANGLSVGNFDNTVAVSVDDAPLRIGNDHADASYLQSPIWAVLVMNVELTATQHAQVYTELMS